jgi:hypothetical protein
VKSKKIKLLEKYKDIQMKYFQNILLIVLSIGFACCETSVDADDLLEKEQLVVINGYISPQDELLRVQVSKSISRATSDIKDQDLVIKDATVVITDIENNEAVLTYVDTTLSYEAPASDLEIIPGKMYFLTVMTQGNEYKASCTIPINLTQVTTDIQIQYSEYGDDGLLKVLIEDVKEQQNFYVVGAEVTQYFQQYDNTIDENVSTIDFEFEQFVTDVSRENAIVSANGFFRFLGGALPERKIQIQVANTEKILYNALRSTFLNNYNDGDVIAEPIIPPNNIEGKNGFGVFAGFQLTEIEVTFTP